MIFAARSGEPLIGASNLPVRRPESPANLPVAETTFGTTRGLNVYGRASSAEKLGTELDVLGPGGAKPQRAISRRPSLVPSPRRSATIGTFWQS